MFGSAIVSEVAGLPAMISGPEEAETRYALPQRPVNPLDTMAEVKHKSAAQRPQRRNESCPSRYGGDCGKHSPELSADGVLSTDPAESVLDFRRWNGEAGRR